MVIMLHKFHIDQQIKKYDLDDLKSGHFLVVSTVMQSIELLTKYRIRKYIL